MIKKIPAALLIFAVVLVLALSGLALFQEKTMASTDSGVKACQDMAVRQATQANSSGEMSAASYAKALEPFEASSHADLRTAGVNFVNTAWEAQQVLKAEDTALESSFGALTKLNVTYSSLQVACQNHGVTLKSLLT